MIFEKNDAKVIAMIDLTSILIILVVVIAGVGVAVFFVKKEINKLKQEEEKDNTALNLLKQDLDGMKDKFEKGFNQMSQELGKVEEVGRNIKDFQDVLKSPKLRGNLGEQILTDLLEQILPQDNFQTQYQFEEGGTVDAIVKTKQGIIPIDSKFPMEIFRSMKEEENESEKKTKKKKFVREVKKRIDSISKKYILPQEGTVDFALMYVPSEPVYYEITLNVPDLLDYGHKKKVYFVSPNTFYYLLRIIMMGLEGAKIEKASKKILEGLKAVKQTSDKFGNELSTLTSHIEHARTASDRVRSEYEKLAARIENLSSLKTPGNQEEVEKGNLESDKASH